MSQSVAAECIYALPRGGKKIEGPSSRFAEVVISCWQNSRAGTRVVSVDDKTITAQGVFHDLERNVAVTYESRRRITDSKGNRFNDDMITMTGNAACSIALRNAVLKGVPKAFWAQIYERARHAVIGDVKSLVQSRQQAIELFGKMGVTPEMVFHALGIQGIEDIDGDMLITLRATYSSLKNGEATLEEVFGSSESARIDELAKALNWNTARIAMMRGQYKGRVQEMIAYLEAEVEKLKPASNTKAEAKAETKAEPADATQADPSEEVIAGEVIHEAKESPLQGFQF